MMKFTAQRRIALMAKVHALVRKLGYDEGTYRTVLLTQTGKTSCRDMTDAQLSRLEDALECLSQGKSIPRALKVPRASLNGLGGQMLPTVKQWETLATLAHREGWSGLSDFRLLSFVMHTVKVADLAELSRAEMSKVISGLSRMLSQRTKTERQEVI